jgi:hypothetical protein
VSSPSFLHEGLIALVRDRPAFAAELLREVLHVDVPKFTEARMGEASLNELVPVELRADAVVLLENGKPVCGIVGEAQLSPDTDKLYSWPAYAIVGRLRHRCPVFVVVITPDAATARWASQPIDLEDGNVWSPRVVGPDGIPILTDRERARRQPQLSVLSCIAPRQRGGTNRRPYRLGSHPSRKVDPQGRARHHGGRVVGLKHAGSSHVKRIRYCTGMNLRSLVFVSASTKSSFCFRASSRCSSGEPW